MSILINSDLDPLRNSISRDISGIPWTKVQINNAMQAIEDTFSSLAVQNALSAAIDTALTATNAQKRQLVKHYLLSKFNRGN